jgi:hypothetical protein
MTASGRISNIDHVRLGDVLCKYYDGEQEATVLGMVIEITTNSKGRKAVVLDREFTLNRNHEWARNHNYKQTRLTQQALSTFYIRRQR